jgi:hypothetical protein
MRRLSFNLFVVLSLVVLIAAGLMWFRSCLITRDDVSRIDLDDDLTRGVDKSSPP